MATSTDSQGKPKPGGDGGGRARRANSADSTPLTDPHTYTDGVGFEPGNAAKSDKFKTVDGKIVDDLKGEPGWAVVVKGDRVTPAIARELAGKPVADDES